MARSRFSCTWFSPLKKKNRTVFQPPGLTFASIAVPGCDAAARVPQVRCSVNAWLCVLAPHLLQISSGGGPKARGAESPPLCSVERNQTTSQTPYDVRSMSA